MMKYKLIINENKYVQGATVKLNVGEALLFSKAIKCLYFDSQTHSSDKKVLKQMIIDIEKEKFNV